MMKSTRILLILIGILFLASILSLIAQSGNYKNKYVGISKCKSCHSDGAIGNQFASWSNNPHSLAFEKLSNFSARLEKIKTKTGISNPASNTKCLTCHTTGGFRADNYFKEGVGCEGCHGPGQNYMSYGNHAGSGGYRKALKVGMLNIIGDANINARKRICMKCHSPNRRLCKPDDINSAKKEELSLQQIVATFSHKLKK